MSEQPKGPMARSVHVHFPNGDRQYWLTSQDFTRGSRIRHNGDEWIVIETRPTSDGAIDLVLRASEPAVDERDPGPAREVWPVNAPEVAAHVLPRGDADDI
jgi:hypothetical protein